MAVTVPSAASGPFTPNGVATVFGFDFKAISAGEVSVVLADTEEVVDSGSYTVALDASGEGGTVTFTLPPRADDPPFVIVSTPKFQQQGTFTGGERPFTPSAINRLLDEGVARDLALRDRVERAIVVPRGGNPGQIHPAESGVLTIIRGEASLQPLTNIIGNITDLFDDGPWETNGNVNNDGVWC